MKNRRRHFLIDKPLQFRYMAWILFILLVVSGTIFVSLYFGIWGQALKEFSDESIRNSLQTTSRLHDYEAARFESKTPVSPRLAFIQETEMFSNRQREILHDILEKSNKRLLYLSAPLFFFIAWSTIFLSHKTAGPLYHLTQALKEVRQKNLRIRVHLRKFDEGEKLADSFNQAADELDKAVVQLKKTLKNNQDSAKLINDISKQLSEFKTSEE